MKGQYQPAVGASKVGARRNSVTSIWWAGMLGTLAVVLGTSGEVARAADPVNLSDPIPLGQMDIGVTIDTVCSGSAVNGSNLHTDSVGTGLWKDQLGDPTQFRTFCNDEGGYSIYAIGFTGDEEGNTSLVSDISDGAGGFLSIASGTAKEGAASNWSFKLQSNSAGLAIPAEYADHTTIPDGWALVAQRTSGLVSPDAAEADSFQATYGAYIASNQISGTYTGQVKYMLLNPNTKAPFTTIEEMETMQEFTALSAAGKKGVKALMPVGQQYTLKDARDGKTYYVAKMADGNVWMTQNLDYDLNTDQTLTPLDTDLPAGATWTPSAANLAGTWATSATLPYSYNTTDLCWTGTVATTAGNLTNATRATACNDSTNPHYRIGNYYNWTAAVALMDSSAYATKGQDLDQSICPAGWRLPKPSGDPSMVNLQTNVVNNGGTFTAGTAGTIQGDPFYFTYAGYYRSTSSYQAATQGNYWLSAPNNATTAYSVLYKHDGTLTPQNTAANRSDGFSVRCVLR